MTSNSKTGQATGLHVLVVDEDLAALGETCGLLSAEGHRISAFSRALGLPRLIEELRPDLLLIDVLMPDLDRNYLTDLLASCRRKGGPPVVLHSRLSERMLRTVVNTADAAGIVQKTSSKLEFLLAFNTVLDRMSPDSRATIPQHGAMSGTHRIGTGRGEEQHIADDEDTLRTGSTR